MTATMLKTDKAKALAKKTLKDILTLEGGPAPCKVYPGLFYEVPMWVPEALKPKEAKDAFDYKNDKEEATPTRIFPLPLGCNLPSPHDRFNPYRVHYSATHLDWYRHKSDAEQAIIKSAVYNTKVCPRLVNEWDYFTRHALKQNGVELKIEHKNPATYLAFYRFVMPVVQLVDVPSPCPQAVFQLRYDPQRKYFFYLGFVAGVAADDLEDMLVGTHPVRN